MVTFELCFRNHESRLREKNLYGGIEYIQQLHMQGTETHRITEKLLFHVRVSTSVHG